MQSFKTLLRHLDSLHDSDTVSPRGEATKEILNASYCVPYSCFLFDYPSRKFNLPYLKEEIKWYLRGDPNDYSITKYAKIWQDIRDKGTIVSNYGVPLFHRYGFQNMLMHLAHDKDTRRAFCPILHADHIRSVFAADVPCTLSVGFTIRNDVLDMHISMRSQDAWYGMANDVGSFGYILILMYNKLKAHHPLIKIGKLNFHVVSFHVYEKFFDNLRRLVPELQAYPRFIIPIDHQEEWLSYE